VGLAKFSRGRLGGERFARSKYEVQSRTPIRLVIVRFGPLAPAYARLRRVEKKVCEFVVAKFRVQDRVTDPPPYVGGYERFVRLVGQKARLTSQHLQGYARLRKPTQGYASVCKAI
jgi:hypothetical protein